MQTSSDNARVPEDGRADAKDDSPAVQRDGDESEKRPKEIGGRDGPDPTRYGDWEKAGRCIDF